MSFEQMSGCAQVTGESNGQMFAPGGFADPAAGMHAAVALQAALAERDATGEGRLIEIAQVEVVASMTAEQVIHHSLSGEILARDGNRSGCMAPQGIYRCKGNDEWIALSVRDDDDWRRLCEALGSPSWARDSELSSLAGRARRHDEIDAHLASWAASLDARVAAEHLQRAGIPAARLLKNDDFYGEPQLEAGRYFQELEHTICGRLRFPGWPMRFSFMPDGPHAAAAPTLGQHNDEILGGLLGLSANEIQDLRSARVTGERIDS
jgi:crotonobetainyl-CoA:carnitine CoA-transferase CaiB-like acyl-CoA transferase